MTHLSSADYGDHDDDSEAEGKVIWIDFSNYNDPRCPLPEPMLPTPPPPVVKAAPVTGFDEESFWNAYKRLTHCRRYAQAMGINPSGLLMVDLLRVSAAIPPCVKLPPIIGAPASLNMFVAEVGASGEGKSVTEDASFAYLEIVGSPADTEQVGSGESFAAKFLEPNGLPKTSPDYALVRNDKLSLIFVAEEIAALAAHSARNGASLMHTLRTMWSGKQFGSGAADKDRDRKVPGHTYRAGLLIGVQPGLASILFDEIDAGTPQRFLFAPMDIRPEDRPSQAEEKWAGALDRAVLDFGATKMSASIVPVSDAVWREIKDARFERAAGNRSEALDGHRLLCREKLAVALSVYCTGRVEITDEMWALSDVLMAISDRTRAVAAEGARKSARRDALRAGELRGVTASAADEAKAAESDARMDNNIRKHLDKSGPLTTSQVEKKFRYDYRAKLPGLPFSRIELRLLALRELGKLALSDGKWSTIPGVAWEDGE